MPSLPCSQRSRSSPISCSRAASGLRPECRAAPRLLLQARRELSHGFDHPAPGPHGPLGVVLVRQGVAEVDEQAITEILRNMPVKAGNHLGAGVLISTHDLTQVFRVELA